jgi:hypothetical protein
MGHVFRHGPIEFGVVCGADVELKPDIPTRQQRSETVSKETP